MTGALSFVGNQFRKFSKFKDVDEVSLIDNQPDVISFKNYDVVLHLAAIVHQKKSIPTEVYFKVNRDLAFEVAQKAKSEGVKQFIFFSTLKVYGTRKKDGQIQNEESECFPDDPYAKSKYEAEELIKGLSDTDFVVSIIRPSLVYGIGVKANMEKLIKLVERFKILPFGKINNKRNYIYTENLIALIDKTIEKRMQGILIAIDPAPVSTSELIQFIARALGKKRYLFHLYPFLIQIFRFLFPGIISRLYDSSQFDNTITLKRLEFSIPFTTEEGIRRTLV